MKWSLALSVLVLAVGSARATWDEEEEDWWDYDDGDDREYTNEWVAEIQGGEHVAKRVARDHGFRYDGPAKPFDDHYLLTREDHPEVSFTHRHDLTKRMLREDEVKWAEQQQIMKYELK